jgi:hypothetical protein
VQIHYDFILTQGAPFSERFELKEDDGTTPIPLTDYTAHMEIRSLPNELGGVLFATSSPLTLVIDEEDGSLDINLTPAQTETLNFDLVAYVEVLLNPPGDGNAFPFITGRAVLNKRVAVIPVLED